MSTPSKRKGVSWESRIVDYLRSVNWPHAERRALHGVNDKGDITGLPTAVPVVIEAKNAARVELAAWVDEANREAANVGPTALGVVWAHRKGKGSPDDGYVVMDGATFAAFLGFLR